MKEFKEIVDGIAHSLNMTVDSLVKIYPQLRTEYSWYYVCDNLQDISFIAILVVIALSGIFILPPILMDDHDDDNYIMAVKALKWVLALVVVLFVVVIVSTVLKGFMCPDIMIIKEFLK